MSVDDLMRRLGPDWGFVIDGRGDPVFYRKSDKAAAEAARKIELAAARAATLRGRIDRLAIEGGENE